MSWDRSVLRHRRGFLAATFGGVAAAVLASTGRARAQGVSNVVTVGIGGDFPDLESALAAISPSPSNGYQIKLLPGLHVVPPAGLSLKPYVSIDGCGQGVSEIVCAGTGVIRVAAGVTLSNLTLSGDFLSLDEGPGILVDAGTRVLDFRLRGVSMYVTGGYGAAVAMVRDNTCFFSDVDIYTTSMGLQLGGICHCNGLRVFMSGTATGTPYYGVHVPGAGRIYLWGSKVCTGYGYPDRAGFDPGLEVVDDPLADVIGIYIPGTNEHDPRVECYGLNSYARNDVAEPRVAVHAVRADAGRVRLYGGVQQAEVSGNVRATLYQTGPGIIETFGDRFSGAFGNIWGTNTTGTSRTDIADHNRRLSDASGGVVLCDASGGPYTLRLPGTLSQFRNGIRFVFVKTDTTPNAVIIDGGALMISGLPTAQLAAPYVSLEVIGTPEEWLVI